MSEFRTARADDLLSLTTLLRANTLPGSGLVVNNLRHFFVCTDDSEALYAMRRHGIIQ